MTPLQTKVNNARNKTQIRQQFASRHFTVFACGLMAEKSTFMCLYFSSLCQQFAEDHENFIRKTLVVFALYVVLSVCFCLTDVHQTDVC